MNAIVWLQIPSAKPNWVNFVRVFAVRGTVKPVAVAMVRGDERGQSTIDVSEIGAIESVAVTFLFTIDGFRSLLIIKGLNAVDISCDHDDR